MGADPKAPHYTLTYRYSWVYDDDSASGGGDHITNWSESTIPLTARTDRGAWRQAAAYVDAERKKKPGRYFAAVRVEHVIPEQRREVSRGC